MSQIAVILKEKVINLGAEADVIKVKRGYALNFLIPQGKAFEATPGNLKQIESLKQARAIRESDELEAATKLANRLNKQRLKFELATGQGGKAFGSVTSKDIQNSLSETDRQQIVLKRPIKRTGDFDVEIKIHQEVTAILKIKVSAVVTEQKGQDESDNSDS